MRADLRTSPGGAGESLVALDATDPLRIRQDGDRSWMDRSACRDAVTGPDDDVFFAPEVEERGRRRGLANEQAERERAALELCARCPVQAECLAYAVATRQQHGIWGGRTEAQLHALIARTGQSGRRAPIDVGTVRGQRVGSLRPLARRSHCPVGHPYDQANTYVTAGGKRHCSACRRTRALAQQRQLTARRTHCPQGHPYDQANTDYDARGRRRCRTCRRARGQAESRSIAGQRAARAPRGRSW
jgi:Transcription factor WhiB